MKRAIFTFLVLLVLELRISKVSSNECGTVELIEQRIASGEHTSRGAWPFLAALYYIEQSEFFCGATLISTKNVLTAAHCVQQKNVNVKLIPEDVAVLLGAYNLDHRIERGVQQRDVEEIYVHPDWKPFSERYDADLAIFVLKEIVEFTKQIRPICMPDDDVPVDAKGSIVGWGLSEDSKANKREAIPRYTFTEILNDTYCYTSQQFIAIFSSPRIFCGGGEGGSPNKGDSGGGLFVQSGSTWVQYGIISASLSDPKGNVFSNTFSLYTDVNSFKNWIDETVTKSGSSVLTIGEKNKTKTDIWCNYEIVLETKYKCSVWGSNITDANFVVDAFTGTHLSGYAAQNVSEIWFWTGVLDYIPDGIGRKFKNLEKIWVGYEDRNLGLKLLKRDNFKNMILLWYLNAPFNNIETVDEDTLRDLPKLKYFVVPNNKLKMLHTKLFEKNTELIHVNANSNHLEFLHDDLFKNNLLLEEAYFKDNKLTAIFIDFAQFRHIKKIEFQGNICIDESLKDVNNLTEFQTSLFNCSGINERILIS